MLIIADKILQIYDDFEGFYGWLEKMRAGGALKELLREGDTLRLRGLAAASIGRNIDPISNFICLAFALFGPFWPFLPGVDDAFKTIRERRRKRVQTEEGASGLQKPLDEWVEAAASGGGGK